MKGEKIAIIGGSVQSAGEIYYVAKKGSPIKTIQDLRGKTVGYTSPGSVTQAVLELSLNAAGMKSSDVNSRAMGGINEAITGLLAGALDATANLEPLFSKNPTPFQIVVRVGDYIPAFEQTVIITRREFLEQNPEAVRRFLKGFAASVDYIRKNPDAAAKAWAEESELDPKVTRSAIDVYLKNDQWNVGFRPEALYWVGQSMRVLNTVKPNEEVAWKDLIVQDYLPDGVRKIDLTKISAQ
jgi:NitT/TauT family transport system substrate-binding protein